MITIAQLKKRTDFRNFPISQLKMSRKLQKQIEKDVNEWLIKFKDDKDRNSIITFHLTTTTGRTEIMNFTRAIVHFKYCENFPFLFF